MRAERELARALVGGKAVVYILNKVYYIYIYIKYIVYIIYVYIGSSTRNVPQVVAMLAVDGANVFYRPTMKAS